MKTILITGSSRGIGAAIARQAHAKGYIVILHGRTNSPSLQKLHAELIGSHVIYCDIAYKTATLTTIKQVIEKIGPIDVLVTNAATAHPTICDISDIDDTIATHEYAVNFLGTIHCIQAVLPDMQVRGKGCIITISSIKGHPKLTTLSSVTYGATKSSVIALTKALAKAYPTIRFNSVSPGYVLTDQAKQWGKKSQERIRNGSVLGRAAEPTEIAAMVLYLASDNASYMTGADFVVDGGYSLK